MNDIKPELSQKLKILRKRSKMTQNEVANILHLNRSTYAYYESGRAVPALKTVVQLADLHDVSTDYLLKGECR
jgi:DNA-binding XRE family transcriptional regulator